MTFQLGIPSRERVHIPPREKENHLQICRKSGGYVNSLKGNQNDSLTHLANVAPTSRKIPMV